MLVGEFEARKDAAVGVFGWEGDDLEVDTASMCVGKARGGEDAVGRTGTSIVGGKCAFGSEVGYVRRDRAESILYKALERVIV